jgi:DNA-binding response OmpR family regulator
MSERGKPLVLVVDEIPSVIRLLELELSLQGFEVAGCEVGPPALAAIEKLRPDVVLLEIILPGTTGFEMIRQIRERFAGPVVFLTTDDNESDRIFAFELGASDYITKPFDPEEVGLRLSALLGLNALHIPVVEADDVRIDLFRRLVWRQGRPMTLGTNEWALLFALASKQRPVPAAELIESVWGSGDDARVEYLEFWIARLRQRLQDDPSAPSLIQGGLERGFWLNLSPDHPGTRAGRPRTPEE